MFSNRNKYVTSANLQWLRTYTYLVLGICTYSELEGVILTSR